MPVITRLQSHNISLKNDLNKKLNLPLNSKGYPSIGHLCPKSYKKNNKSINT